MTRRDLMDRCHEEIEAMHRDEQDQGLLSREDLNTLRWRLNEALTDVEMECERQFAQQESET